MVMLLKFVTCVHTTCAHATCHSIEIKLHHGDHWSAYLAVLVKVEELRWQLIVPAGCMHTQLGK
jgi:hypothetical protein